VNFLRGKNLVSRLRRLVQYFVQTSFVQRSSTLLLLVIPVLMVASPQTGKPPRVGVAADAANQQTIVTQFPQLPYQGSPPELPQDQGTLGLRLMLRRLGTTARLMQTTAHPDDEDGGMLTLEARGHGASVL